MHWLRCLRWRFVHRFTDRYHIVRCDGLKPGYYDVDERMFKALFGLLRDYVEVELAWAYCAAHDIRMPWWTKLPAPIKSQWRSPAYGVCYLINEIKEDGQTESGVKAATEALALYQWYTQDRPRRGDDARSHDLHLEQQCEDTDMAKRLVEIRGCLWT